MMYTVAQSTRLGSSYGTYSVKALGRNLSVGARQARRRNIMISAATPPKGVTQPPTKPVVPAAKFGFVENAEVLNSRAAMIGFICLLVLEAIFNKGLLEMMGVTVGKGLDIGF